MREPRLSTVIRSHKDPVLMTLAGKAMDGFPREKQSAIWDKICAYAENRTWRDILDRFPDMRLEWDERKSARRALRARCYLVKNGEWDDAPNYDGPRERVKRARDHLAYVQARNKRPEMGAREESLFWARRAVSNYEALRAGSWSDYIALKAKRETRGTINISPMIRTEDGDETNSGDAERADFWNVWTVGPDTEGEPQDTLEWDEDFDGPNARDNALAFARVLSRHTGLDIDHAY